MIMKSFLKLPEVFSRPESGQKKEAAYHSSLKNNYKPIND